MMITHITSKLESTLINKCNATDYHVVHKSVAMRESLTGNIRSEDNPPDLLTKLVTGQNQKHLVSLMLYDIYDKDT